MSAHEQVETPNWDTKQRCSCGAEYVSRAELWKHLADSLRAENAENEQLRRELREGIARLREDVTSTTWWTRHTDLDEVLDARLGALAALLVEPSV